ncbi:pantetheine-phosphate adenylyltransferase [Oceanibaculum nanhaiense]|uniref:pantetheine-phosphate adenylyltransferase n=1 Tax=Oceanibaculum nanhaiense TaxID=1909734 RepID=UPI000A388D8B|nr:pantetheine-phosphate adenylyltransferase [Oceanibaculum nanhaiense]|tara:strand:- start:402 stop:938 length:537 start_codon:yes stop_codon:yes gene_type:complete
MNKHLTGVYPGTFDPITHGHLDIIKRASKMVDHLIIGVAQNAGKGPLFSIGERLDLVRGEIAALNDTGEYGHIEARSFSNLLMHFCQAANASLIIRGLRAVSDFEYEFQMAGMNARLDPKIETVFLMASERHHFISSRFVKEIGALGGDISSFVPPRIAERVMHRFAKDNTPEVETRA